MSLKWGGFTRNKTQETTTSTLPPPGSKEEKKVLDVVVTVDVPRTLKQEEEEVSSLVLPHVSHLFRINKSSENSWIFAK